NAQPKPAKNIATPVLTHANCRRTRARLRSTRVAVGIKTEWCRFLLYSETHHPDGCRGTLSAKRGLRSGAGPAGSPFFCVRAHSLSPHQHQTNSKRAYEA